jgi:hypothetical protein
VIPNLNRRDYWVKIAPVLISEFFAVLFDRRIHGGRRDAPQSLPPSYEGEAVEVVPEKETPDAEAVDEGLRLMMPSPIAVAWRLHGDHGEVNGAVFSMSPLEGPWRGVD